MSAAYLYYFVMSVYTNSRSAFLNHDGIDEGEQTGLRSLSEMTAFARISISGVRPFLTLASYEEVTLSLTCNPFKKTIHWDERARRQVRTD